MWERGTDKQEKEKPSFCNKREKVFFTGLL